MFACLQDLMLRLMDPAPGLHNIIVQEIHARSLLMDQRPQFLHHIQDLTHALFNLLNLKLPFLQHALLKGQLAVHHQDLSEHGLFLDRKLSVVHVRMMAAAAHHTSTTTGALASSVGVTMATAAVTV